MQLLSKALERVLPSSTVGISQKARQMQRAGHDVISLSAGEPDFDTPDHIKQAAKAAIDAGETKYTDIDGIFELRQAVADKFARDNGLDVSASDCFVASGGKQVIFNALMATLNPGDEVIIPAPYWVSYPDIVRLAGATPIFALSDQQSGFKLTPEVLQKAITGKTKWLILNSPSNPSGATYSGDELRELALILENHPDIHVLSDDIYEQLIYDGARFATIAEVAPFLAQRTLTVNGVSKSHAMTGWRIGYCCGPKPILDAMEKLQSQSTTNAASISQWAALAALNGDQGFLDQWRAIFQRRRDLVVARLNGIGGIDCLIPNGAFYVFPAIGALIGKTSAGGAEINSDQDFAAALLAENGVALVPGAAFGLAGHLRLSYAASSEQLTQALTRIEDFCARLV
ncbi:Aspartate aminotransferase [hydrothermal vent metagenome]|uniref:Aspartate aminotransferase n=1 Tax=hydrothermal vent metagenome TaxID=652676 RepID=A0A3B0U4E3_9ZZZZ